MSHADPEVTATPEEDIEIDYDPETAPPGGRGVDADGRCTVCGIMVEDCECPLNEDGEACELDECHLCKADIEPGDGTCGSLGPVHYWCARPEDELE
jgi:hypothetical protein